MNRTSFFRVYLSFFLLLFSVDYFLRTLSRAWAFRYLNMRQMFVYIFIHLFIFHYYSNRTEGGKKQKKKKYTKQMNSLMNKIVSK